MATKKKTESAEVTREEVKNQFEETKATASEAWAAVKAFRKKHKLKPGHKYEKGDKSKEAKEYSELMKAHAEAKSAREEKEAELKAMSPARGRTGPLLYDYPEDMTPAERKRSRAAARAKAKKEAKGEVAENPKKDSAPKAKAKKSVKSKDSGSTKVKKATKKVVAPVEDEDED